MEAEEVAYRLQAMATMCIFKGSNNEKQIRKLVAEDNECKGFLENRFKELKSIYLK